MKKLIKWPKLVTSIVFWNIVANVITALAMTGFMVIGALSSVMAIYLTVLLAVLFGSLAFIGKFISKDLEDGKFFLEELEEEINKENEHSE